MLLLEVCVPFVDSLLACDVVNLIVETAFQPLLIRRIIIGVFSSCREAEWCGLIQAEIVKLTLGMDSEKGCEIAIIL